MHPLILRPRALFYRTDCTRRSKFLTHALMIPQVDLFLFVFWRKPKTPKNHFEIIWPLASIILDESSRTHTYFCQLWRGANFHRKGRRRCHFRPSCLYWWPRVCSPPTSSTVLSQLASLALASASVGLGSLMMLMMVNDEAKCWPFRLCLRDSSSKKKAKEKHQYIISMCVDKDVRFTYHHM